jgi:DhnA family fructose-bisphosphate aldolase class Ia
VGAKSRRFSRGEVQDKHHEINPRRNTMKTILATLEISAFLGVLAVLAVIYSGAFNVAATVSGARQDCRRMGCIMWMWGPVAA